MVYICVLFEKSQSEDKSGDKIHGKQGEEDRIRETKIQQVFVPFLFFWI